jgi:hypothetical protein
VAEAAARHPVPSKHLSGWVAEAEAPLTFSKTRTWLAYSISNLTCPGSVQWHRDAHDCREGEDGQGGQGGQGGLGGLGAWGALDVLGEEDAASSQASATFAFRYPYLASPCSPTLGAR